MLSIQIICVGKLKEKFFKDASLEYSKRLSKFCKLDVIEISDEKIPDKLSKKDSELIKDKECSKIISHIKKDSYVLALDLSGTQMSSEEFSEKLDKLSLHSSNITFIIGGSLGLNRHLLSTCNEKICFSKMTFPHQLIRIFLLEQIFRAFKISFGQTYHR